jgi:hypothetical protein
MPPERKVSDDGNSAKPKRKYYVLSLRDKMKLIDLVIKEKKSYAEVGRMFNKNKLSIRKIIKKKENYASVTCAPNTAKVTSILRDKGLVSTEKSLNLWVEDMNGKSVPVDSNSCVKRHSAYTKTSAKERVKKAKASHLLQARDGCIDAEIAMNLKT